MTNPTLFKPYIDTGVPSYQGGKSRKREAGAVFFKLSSNENLLGPSPLALAAIQNSLPYLNEYPEQAGESLHEALSDFYDGVLPPSQFVTENGGSGILELIAHAFLGEGLECIVSNPAFRPYLQFAQNAGAGIVDVPLRGPAFELDVPGICSAINDNTRVIWLCSPNNPTGTYIPKRQVDDLVEHLPAHVLLVYDEVYYPFATAPDYTTALPYVLAGKQVIGINSFSKAHGLAGIRTGYAYSTPEIARYLNHLRRPFLLNTLALEAAKAALLDRAFLQQTVETVTAGKTFLYTALEAYSIRYWESEANFILIQPEMDAFAFEAAMLQQGVMVRPSAAFGAPGCVRVTIGTPQANEAFVKALAVLQNTR